MLVQQKTVFIPMPYPQKRGVPTSCRYPAWLLLLRGAVAICRQYGPRASLVLRSLPKPPGVCPIVPAWGNDLLFPVSRCAGGTRVLPLSVACTPISTFRDPHKRGTALTGIVYSTPNKVRPVTPPPTAGEASL